MHSSSDEEKSDRPVLNPKLAKMKKQLAERLKQKLEAEMLKKLKINKVLEKVKAAEKAPKKVLEKKPEEVKVNL